MRARELASLAVLAMAGAALGFACGSTTRAARQQSPAPPASGGRDDATGLLARLSTATLAEGIDLSAAAAALRANREASGGATYGGARYANYQFHYDYTGALQPQVAPAPYEDYQPGEVVGGGAITGRVTWPRPPRVPATLPSACGPVANDSLRVDRDGGVAGAVVHIDQISHGRSSLPIGGIVERRGCRPWPRIALAAPIGARLRLFNLDPRPWAPVVRDEHGELAHVELAGGQGTSLVVERGGYFSVRAPGETIGSWVVAPRHPYYAITDGDGRFRLYDVPAGRYRVIVWHPPVVTGVAADGNPIATEPLRAERIVRVRPRRPTVVDVRLSGQ